MHTTTFIVLPFSLLALLPCTAFHLVLIQLIVCLLCPMLCVCTTLSQLTYPFGGGDGRPDGGTMLCLAFSRSSNL